MTTPTTQPLEPEGLNELLYGDSGAGKTTALHTIVDLLKPDGTPRYEVFYQGLEPGKESLIGYYTKRGKPIPPNLHWNYTPMTVGDIDELIGAAEKVNQWTLEQLANWKDPNKREYDMAIRFLRNLKDFYDERTGQSYGRVSDWGTDRVFALDGLTGLSRACMSMVVGGKPVRSKPDWGTAMDQVEKYLLFLTDACRCHFVLLGHPEREIDEVSGGTKITIGTLGQKLAPKIPPMFSDVIEAVREGAQWHWDTLDSRAVLKARNYPVQAKLPPSFQPAFDAWEKSRAEIMKGGL